MKALILVLVIALAIIGCGGKKDGGISAGGRLISSDNKDPDPAPGTCGVAIDESSLRTTAISWMRVARGCGG